MKNRIINESQRKRTGNIENNINPTCFIKQPKITIENDNTGISNKASIRTRDALNETFTNYMNRLFETMREYMEQTEYGQNQQIQLVWKEKTLI